MTNPVDFDEWVTHVRDEKSFITFALGRKTPTSGKLPEDELNRLLMEAKANGLTLDDLAATCEELGMAPQDLLNALSIAIAQCYLAGSLPYAFCDGVMNGIIGAIIDVGMTNDMPQPAFSLYQAFDQGEWVRRNDPPDTDPSEKYVKPLVLQIVRDLPG